MYVYVSSFLQTISDFARERFKEFKVVYVSVDVDEQWYKAGVKGQVSEQLEVNYTALGCTDVK
jgi:hypothetical protein